MPEQQKGAMQTPFHTVTKTTSNTAPNRFCVYSTTVNSTADTRPVSEWICGHISGKRVTAAGTAMLSDCTGALTKQTSPPVIHY